MKKNYTKKQAKKFFDKNCYFCGEDCYELLDAHRILPGCDGGKYHERNMITVCACCHRRIHGSGEIVIDKKYLSTKGWVLHYFVDGVEHWRDI